MTSEEASAVMCKPLDEIVCFKLITKTVESRSSIPWLAV